MTFEEALKQLKKWETLSNGELVEISPENFRSFKSYEIYTDEQINSLERSIEWNLPPTYKLFLKSIGKSKLFLHEYGLGTTFFSPEEILTASEEQVWESWENERIDFPYRYCMIGAETGLGDFFGFTIGISSSKNFDIYCHEYPPIEYVEVSDEVNSWKTFDKWIIEIVESFGEKRL